MNWLERREVMSMRGRCGERLAFTAAPIVWRARTGRWSGVVPVLCLFWLLHLTAHASALGGENLLQPMPAGYNVGYHDKQAGSETIEYVPAGESVDNWTGMLTVQLLRASAHVTPDEFLQDMAMSWSRACPGSETVLLTANEENVVSVCDTRGIDHPCPPLKPRS